MQHPDLPPPDAEAMARLEAWPVYRQWRARLAASGAQVEAVYPLNLLPPGGSRLLFALVYTKATGADGHPLLPLAFLRGNFVSVLVALFSPGADVPKVLLVRQKRIATGGFIYEHPAGMTDGQDPAEVAIREVKEETGVDLHPTDLIPLESGPYYSSPGLMDEGGHFFAAELRLPHQAIEALDGQRHGLADEWEHIHTRVATIPQARRLIENTNGLLELYLYLEHKNRWDWLLEPTAT